MLRRTSLILLAVLGVSLWSAGPASAAVLVKAKGIRCTPDMTTRFVPKAVTVADGTTLKWKSSCGNHTVTSTSPNWSKNTTIQAGESTTRTFNNPGVYRYRCRFHSALSQGKCLGMCGRVTVT